MTILGIKRSKSTERNSAGKICLNYYLSDNYLKIPTGRGEKIDRYCARNYSKAKYLAGDYKLFQKFMKKNQELFARYHVSSIMYQVSSGRKKYELPSVIRLFEGMLSGKFGDWVEARLKSSQIRRIESDPITQKYPDLIVYNDRELRFHPPKKAKVDKV